MEVRVVEKEEKNYLGRRLSIRYQNHGSKLQTSLANFKGPEFLKDPNILNLLRFESKKGSKWANDEWIGREELYSSFERALNDLKSYDQLKVFYHRVHSREAPDYYDSMCLNSDAYVPLPPITYLFI
ncbi:Transcriptional activator spt7 [Coelomomyces lativittatus]|nr:Transcriptional activator spt7 [Coelomomyces lativittatus]